MVDFATARPRSFHAIQEFGVSKTGVNRDEVADGSIRGALSSALAALPEGALEEFRRSPDRSASGGHALWRMRFECVRVNGLYQPLLADQRSHPVWHEISSARARGCGSSAGVVLPHHLVLFVPERHDAPAEALLVPDEEIRDFLIPVSGVGRLSTGEIRVLKQVICGIDLADAARADGVTRETKRTQFKSVARKFECHSQVEVASLSLTRLLLALRAEPAASINGGDALFRELAGRFLPEGRTLEIVADSGQRHRFVDIGPHDGRVIAMAHPQVLPDIRAMDVRRLHEQGLRLVVPLRAGAMTDVDAALDPPQHLNHAIEGIDLLRTHFAGAQVDLLGCISGVPYALTYARTFPARVRSLALAGSPAGLASTGSVAAAIRQGFYQLAGEHWPVLSRVLDFYGRRINRPETFRSLLSRHYRQSLSDLKVIEAEFAAPHFGERARRLFVSSMGSIKHDFLNQARLDWGQVPSGIFPILFLHGAHDPVHPVEHARVIARRLPGSHFCSLPLAGQLLYHQHFEPMLSAYASFLTDHAPARNGQSA
jgi:pimeloyl-ACP methyl ester carboxylesterase/DNA-binding CsgD family transcriptional regulator